MPEDVGEFLTQQWGPLPVWGWGVAIVGGFGIGYFVLTNMQSGGDGDGELERRRRPIKTEGAMGPPGAGGTTETVDNQRGFTTNAQWHREVLNWLIEEQGVDAVKADEALSRYLGGQKLGQNAQGIIGKALTEWGRPPQGAPTIRKREPDGGDESTDPTPVPGWASVAGRDVRMHGDRLTHIHAVAGKTGRHTHRADQFGSAGEHDAWHRERSEPEPEPEPAPQPTPPKPPPTPLPSYLQEGSTQFGQEIACNITVYFTGPTSGTGTTTKTGYSKGTPVELIKRQIPKGRIEQVDGCVPRHVVQNWAS